MSSPKYSVTFITGSILINHQRENNFCYFDFLEFTGLAQSDCSVPILSITRGPAYFYDCTFLGSGYPDRLYKISVSDSGRFELDSCQFEKPTTPVTIKIGDGGQMNATTCGCKLWPNAVEVLEGGSLALAECNVRRRKNMERTCLTVVYIFLLSADFG
jgi:hypothetical protein